MNGDNQRQRGVQTAGQTDNRCFCVCMADTGCQAGCLQRQNFLAAFCQIVLIGRNKRCLCNRACQLGLSQLHIKRDFRVIKHILCVESVLTAALIVHTLDINFRNRQTGCKALGLRENRAVFCNNIVCGKDQIRRRFALTGITVHITALSASRLHPNQIAAVCRLANNLIRSGQIIKNRRACGCQCTGRRIGYPQIFTDFCADGKFRHLCALEYLHRAECKFLIAPSQILSGLGGCLGKMTQLIELGIVRNIALWHHAQNIALVQNSGAVIQRTAHTHRNANQNQHVHVLGLLGDAEQLLLGAFQQNFMQKQIRTGISGQTQLRKTNHLHALFVRLLTQRQNIVCIECAVRHMNFRRGCRDFDKTVFHNNFHLRNEFSCSPACRHVLSLLYSTSPQLETGDFIPYIYYLYN